MTAYEDLPLIGKLLSQHGVDPHRVPEKFAVEIARDMPGIYVDTVAPDPDGDPYGLVDGHGEPVVYRKFYPEPKEPR